MTKPIRKFFQIAALVAILALCLVAGAEEKTRLKPIQDRETLATIDRVLKQVEALRGLKLKGKLTCYYLDSPTLRSLVQTAVDKQFPGPQRKAVEEFLSSLRIIPEGLDILHMYLGLLDEQVAGLYDHDSKALFVRKKMNIADSALARLILAHEICHALQDGTYSFKRMGIEAEGEDDRAMATLSVAEGDAMLLMSAYSLTDNSANLTQDIAQMMSMSQDQLDAAPHFFKQQMLFPYIQGQALLTAAMEKGGDAREKLFTDPPQTTEQVIHPEKYFGKRDTPRPVPFDGGDVPMDFKVNTVGIPQSPDGFELRDKNRMGELGVRLMFEERLGVGIAHTAAAGWDGDRYVAYAGPEDAWWFGWESVWDTNRDAREFADAFVTYWRAQTGERNLGKLGAKEQTFQAGDWQFHIVRNADRVAIDWANRPAR